MKFNVYDRVWYKRDNEIQLDFILVYQERASERGDLTTESTYAVGSNPSDPESFFDLHENQIFATKQELIDSL